MAELNKILLEANSFGTQLPYAQALASCSRILQESAPSEDAKISILNNALKQLCWATGASRTFLCRNSKEPKAGLRSVEVAVAHNPNYFSRFGLSSQMQMCPWYVLPQEARRSLRAGLPFGGVVETAFAATPDFTQTVIGAGVLSLFYLPVHFGDDEWWGFIGFEDRERAKEWQDTEIFLLSTVAELFASTLQRWQQEAKLEREGNYQEALFRCSRVLHEVIHSEDDKLKILNQALEHLRDAVQAGRAYLFENFVDPELGPCMAIRAEACAPGVHPHIDYPANQRSPWSAFPSEMRQTLKAGEPYGGPIDYAFASKPEWVETFKQQRNPLLSLQFFPIHIGDDFWGYVGFDDVKNPREWSVAEIRILQVSAELISSTFQRWHTEKALRAELQERRRKEERLRLLESVVVNTSEGVLITAAQPLEPPGPHILYVNEAFSRMTGYEAEDVIGQNPRILQGTDTSRQELNRLRAALDRQEPVYLELLNYRKDGSAFWVAMSIVPVFDDNNTCTHFVAVQRDVTKRRHAEKGLQAAKQELEDQVATRTSQLLRTNERLRLEIISRRQAEVEVKNRLAVEQNLANLSARLFDEQEPLSILPALLRDVGRMVNARRVALIFLEQGGEAIGEIHEWCSPDIHALDRNLISNAMSSLAWFQAQFKENRFVFIEDVEQMSSATVAERQIIQEMGTQSIAVFPLYVDGNLVAILFSSYLSGKGKELNQQLDVLSVIVGLMGSMLRRESLLDYLEQRAIDRTRELSALYDMAMLAAESENLSDILGPAVSKIMEVVRCQAVSVYELSADRTNLRLVAQYGLHKETDFQAESLSESFRHWFDEFREPIIEHRPGEATWLPGALRPKGFAVYIGVQLRARGKVLGILNCYQQFEGAYSLNSTALLVALAEQLGIIIENYRLRQLAEEGAIIEERQRLARELHDAITQSLYSVTLFARSSFDALEAGDLPKVAETIAEVEDNALRALKEMRLMLHQLQPLALEQGGLVSAIEKRLNQVERRLGIEAELVVGSGLNIRPQAEGSIYRIITEALNNSLQHSGATTIRVVLREEHALLRLIVEDNGCGFDIASLRLGLGIENMKKRAELLRGEMSMKSKQGEGTTIGVDLPIEWLE